MLAPGQARKWLTLVEFADSVFDMLAQQTSFVGRHMAITTTLIEIGGNSGAQDHIRRRVLDRGIVAIESARLGRALARSSVGGRLGMGERGSQ